MYQPKKKPVPNINLYEQKDQARLDRDLIEAVEWCDPERVKAALTAHGNARLTYTWSQETSAHEKITMPDQTLLHTLVDWSAGKPPERIRQCFDLLVKAGADINAQDGRGNTPLHATLICEPWNKTAMIALLEAGAEVNVRGIGGYTALHWAACYREAMPARILLAVGAKTDLYSDPTELADPMQPIDLAEKHDNPAALKVIQKAMAADAKEPDAKKVKTTFGLDLGKRAEALAAMVEAKKAYAAGRHALHERMAHPKTTLLDFSVEHEGRMNDEEQKVLHSFSLN